MQEKVIYLAGGCFWGMQKAIDLLNGVLHTEVGYANGNKENPTYEEVCTGELDARETVKVIYDPEQISLEKILKAFFLCINPTQTNQQGNDIGSQYQTGVYYDDEEDLPIIEKVFEEKKKETFRFCVECAECKNFYTAEEYHQKYLDKNPTGYCHISKVELDEVKKLNEGN